MLLGLFLFIFCLFNATDKFCMSNCVCINMRVCVRGMIRGLFCVFLCREANQQTETDSQTRQRVCGARPQLNVCVSVSGIQMRKQRHLNLYQLTVLTFSPHCSVAHK